jgi:hypothetical protein
MNNDGSVLAGAADGTLLFRVVDGEHIGVDIHPQADPDFARVVIGGELLGALLRQRGLLVLHAACVQKDGKGIVFVGYSGWGKSTTAAYLAQSGYDLLTDDVLAVHLGPEGAFAYPGPVSIRLRPDAGARLAKQFEDLPRVYSSTAKRIAVKKRPAGYDRVKLEKVYFLEGEWHTQNEVASVSQRSAFIECLRHTRITRMLKTERYRLEHFNQCKQLLHAVPVALLRRRKSLDQLPAIKRVIERDLGLSSA